MALLLCSRMRILPPRIHVEMFPFAVYFVFSYIFLISAGVNSLVVTSPSNVVALGSQFQIRVTDTTYGLTVAYSAPFVITR